MNRSRTRTRTEAARETARPPSRSWSSAAGATRRLLAYGLVLGLSAALSACTGIPVPRGYISIEEPVPPVLMDAFASSGNRYQIREHDNPEGATLEFWVDAIRRELVNARGYELIAEAEMITAGGDPGRELEFHSEHQLEDYHYLVAVFVDGDRVVVCEAGGAEDSMRQDRDEIRKAMLGLDL